MKKLALIISLFSLPLVCVESQEPPTVAAPTSMPTDEVSVSHAPTISSDFVIDTIEAVVLGQYGTEIITRSDIERPSLTGQMRTLDDIVFERLVVLDAVKHKIPMDDDAVDKYLTQIQRDNGLTMDQLNEVFSSAGYTLKEGREQLGLMQTVNTMLDFKVRSGLIVPRKSIEAYYEEHPEKTEARYLVQYARVPFDKGQQEDAQYVALQKYAQTGKGSGGIAWSEPFWIAQSEVADDKTFIFDLAVGSISQPQKMHNGFEMYRLKDKKEAQLRTLEERYREIANVLRQPRYQELMQEYREGLFASASILYL